MKIQIGIVKSINTGARKSFNKYYKTEISKFGSTATAYNTDGL